MPIIRPIIQPVIQPVIRPVGGFAGGSLAFNPASLFAGGGNGFTFHAAPSTTFTDTSGTVPAAANDGVSALRTDAGTVTILTQSASTKLVLRGTPTGANVLGEDGDFFTPGNWTLGAGWSIADGTLTGSTASTTAVLSLPAASGKVYQVAYLVTRSAGSVAATYGGTSGRSRAADGSYEEWIEAAGTGDFTLTGTGFTGTISQVRVYAADAADVAAPYYLTGTGTQWLESALSGFTAYPITMAGQVGSWSVTAEAGLISAYEGFTDLKAITSARALDWDGGSLVSGYSGGSYEGTWAATVGTIAPAIDTEADLLLGGQAANANAFGTKSNVFIGRTRPDILYVDGRIYSGLLIDRDLTSDETASLNTYYKADRAVQCWGDSLTAGSGVDTFTQAYPIRLRNQLFRYVENNGAGGETSAQITARFVADTSDKKQWIQILWMGTNDAAYSGGWGPTLANFATCVAGVEGAGRYFVISPMRGEGGGNTKTLIEEIEADLLALYGSRYINARTYLNGFNDGSPEDLADIADGLVPRSLRSDTIHLNNRGYQLVANRVLQAIQDMGWT